MSAVEEFVETTDLRVAFAQELRRQGLMPGEPTEVGTRLVAADLTEAQRVGLGAAWMDHADPGWWQELDLDGLRMRDSCRCVLGQRFGSFNRVVPYQIECRQAELLGFDATTGTSTTSVLAEFRRLAVAWRQLVEQRRAAAAGEASGGGS